MKTTQLEVFPSNRTAKTYWLGTLWRSEQRGAGVEAKSMKMVLFALLAFGFCSAFVQAKEPSKPTDFSGNWVLNLDQTKNPPAGLQQYSMVVNQDEQQLKGEL